MDSFRPLSGSFFISSNRIQVIMPFQTVFVPYRGLSLSLSSLLLLVVRNLSFRPLSGSFFISLCYFK